MVLLRTVSVLVLMGALLVESGLRGSASLGSAAAAAEIPGQGSQAQVADAPFPLVPPERFVTDFAVSEDLQTIVQQSLKSTLLDGITSFDWKRAAHGLSADFRGRFPRPEQGRAIEDDVLSIRQYGAEGLEVSGREHFLETLRAHVSLWTSVDRACWHAFEFSRRAQS